MTPLARSVIRLGSLLAGLATVVVVVGMLPSGCTMAVNHLAFHPDRHFSLPDTALPAGVQRTSFPTADGETIEAFHIAATTRPDRLLLVFHGNAGNVTHRVAEMRQLAAATGAAVLASGYRGYGGSTGSPSEAGIYRDGEAALRHAREAHGFAPAQIVVVGRSLGTTVATHLAAQGDDFAGVILITPLATGRDFGREHMGPISFMAGGSFDNLGRAAAITEPVLVIHGIDDRVIPYEHGRRVHDALPGPKRLLTIPRGGHNDLEFVEPAAYWRAITQFVATPPAAAANSAADQAMLVTL